MAVDISHIISLLNTTGSLLFVVNSDLQKEYILFLEYVYRLRESANKSTVVFITGPADETRNYFSSKSLQTVDKLSEKRLIISIPTKGGTIGSVSYDITDKDFKLFIQPGTIAFSPSDVIYESQGDVFDAVFSFGVPEKELAEKLLAMVDSNLAQKEMIIAGRELEIQIEGFKAISLGTDVLTYLKTILGISRSAKTTDVARSAYVHFVKELEKYFISDQNILADAYKTVSDYIRQGLAKNGLTMTVLPLVGMSSPAPTVPEQSEEVVSAEKTAQASQSPINVPELSVPIETTQSGEPLKSENETNTEANNVSNEPQSAPILRDGNQPLNFGEIAKRIKSTRTT